ncbi:cell surface hyaluronidase-like isoform X2 [Babylonia areolata]|uniref:cell surface hyaluronidase-like isoform X2 n=1 Tax=Babylonia areolata TaxID=304850 RepID=UPI003FD073FE
MMMTTMMMVVMRGRRSRARRVLPVLCCLLYGWGWCVGGVWAEPCPWDEMGLLPWSANSTWGTEGVPVANSQVTIPAGKRVLLDVQPAPLTSLTIEAGAALIWGDVEGLVLDTHHVRVKGEFYIGSRSCRFKKAARIRLHGLINDSYEVTEHEFGRKFIGVSPNATLELHGKRKTAWTKLAQTVKPISEVDFALVYDHTNAENNTALSTKQQGLNVIVWNEDGSLMDFSKFSTYDQLSDFFESVPEGKVMGMYTYGPDGIGTRTSSLVNAIDSLRATEIHSIQDNFGYSFLARRGSTGIVTELLRPINDDGVEVIDFLQLHDSERGLVFQVAANEWTVKRSMMFRVMHADMAFPKLTLADEVWGWAEGDEVLVTSTNFDWTLAETRRIVSCQDCSARQIRVHAPFTHMHWGNFTYNVDERAEVAILSRTIVIEGVMEDTCTERTDTEQALSLCSKFGRDTFGGHLKVVRGFQSVGIRGVQLLHMGQQAVLGAYPVHFHMCDDVRNTYIRETVVVDSFSRCFVCHGTNGLEISNNTCYKHIGHGLFLEDAVEQDNLVYRNLIAGSTHGTLLLSDMSRDWCIESGVDEDYCHALASFWISHPNNNISDNVAAGGDGTGYMVIFADLPLGPSRQRQLELNRTHHPKDIPILFHGNVAHSNKKSGIHMDEKISTGTGSEGKGNVTENAVIRMQNEYDPKVNGTPTPANITNGTYYKNGNENMWIKGNIRVVFTALADSKRGFTGGTTLTESGTGVFRCLFVGETDNVGDATGTIDRSYYGNPPASLTAVSIYQGPNLITDNFFQRYRTASWCLEEGTALEHCDAGDVVTRHAGAISFQRVNLYPTMTSTYSAGNTFGFCDNENNASHWVFQGDQTIPDWDLLDGNKLAFLRDKDGSLTGTVNASIVTNLPMMSGDQCQIRQDWGNLMVCPYRYVQMHVVGNDGNLSPEKRKSYPLVVRRDDSPYDEALSIQGQARNEYLLRTHRSYIMDFNASLENAEYPSKIKVFGYGVERGDVVRVGICQPLNVSGFDITMFYPVYLKNNATWVTSLAALDADTTGAAFYHDQENGILFFKMLKLSSGCKRLCLVAVFVCDSLCSILFLKMQNFHQATNDFIWRFSFLSLL